jgi:hypothetical protein
VASRGGSPPPSSQRCPSVSAIPSAKACSCTANPTGANCHFQRLQADNWCRDVARCGTGSGPARPSDPRRLGIAYRRLHSGRAPSHCRKAAPRRPAATHCVAASRQAQRIAMGISNASPCIKPPASMSSRRRRSLINGAALSPGSTCGWSVLDAFMSTTVASIVSDRHIAAILAGTVDLSKSTGNGWV